MEPRRYISPLAEEEHLIKDPSAERIYRLINSCYDLRVKDNGDIVVVENRRNDGN